MKQLEPVTCHRLIPPTEYTLVGFGVRCQPETGVNFLGCLCASHPLSEQSNDLHAIVPCHCVLLLHMMFQQISEDHLSGEALSEMYKMNVHIYAYINYPV